MKVCDMRLMMRLCGSVVCGWLISWVTTFAAERPPNVVVMFADDLGYADLGCYGGRDVSTPHLDRMATEGVRFTDFYVAQAVCSASRTALLTGCYPQRLGIEGALMPDSRHGLAAAETTLAEVLRDRGYATAIFGKWHLGHWPQFLPTQHGFDEYFGLPYSNDMWPQHPTAKFPELPLVEGDRVIALNPDQTQLTTWYTQRAIQFMEAHREQPFFLYVPQAMPHVPLFVSDKFAGRSPRGLYGDVIAEIDWSMGQILATLQRLKLDEQTLVIFTSDNGPWLSYGDHAGSAGPLREGKGTAWDGGVRVPCLARWPGKIAAGSVCSQPAMTIDLLPTVAGLAQAKLGPLPIDGRNIWPLLAGEAAASNGLNERPLLFYWGRELHAIRQGPWKLHFPHSYRALERGGSGGTPGPYQNQKTPLALYDLSRDLGETTSVAEQHPEVVAELSRLAEAARVDLGDALLQRPGRGVRKADRLD
jgi:arylsulfatase A